MRIVWGRELALLIGISIGFAIGFSCGHASSYGSTPAVLWSHSESIPLSTGETPSLDPFPPRQTPCPVCKCPKATPDTSEILGGTYFSSLSTIDRTSVFQQVFQELPSFDGPRKALFLGRNANPDSSSNTLNDVSKGCHELDVITVGKLSCAVVLHSNQQTGIYHVMRYLRGNETEGKQWSYMSRVKGFHKKPPNLGILKLQEEFLVNFFSGLKEVSKELDDILSRIASKKKDVLVMCINQGNLDLFMNFLQSTRRHNLDVSNLIVFGGDDTVVSLLSKMGVTGYFHPSLGTAPSKASGGYGDTTFIKMMWLKLYSVYLPIRLGYNVLFQDADLVWFKDPFEYFHSNFLDIDTLWMDDGARSERFTPVYANSGFYYLRNTLRTRSFIQDTLFAYHKVFAQRSHQSVVSQILIDHISLNGLSMRLLEMPLFPSGQVVSSFRDLLNSFHSIIIGSH